MIHFLDTTQGKIKLPYLANTQHFSPNVQASIQFCNEWLNGQNEWTIRTSGSTGTPQPITLHRSQLQKSAMATITALQLQPQQNALVALNTQYIAGMMMLVRGLVGNLNLYVVEPSSNPFEQVNSDFEVHFVALVPLQLQQILNEQKEYLLQSAQAIIIGGAAISAELEQTIQQKITAPCYHTYGMTETVSHIALRRINGNEATDCYTALPNTIFSTDERNCLCIQTSICEEKIITNDVVELLNERQFRWIGRADNVINSGGIKVHAERVEQIIAQFLAQKNITHHDFFVAGVSHEVLGEQVVLVVEQSTFTNTQFEQIQKNIQERLGRFFVPKQQYAVHQFMRTETKKINRKATLKLIV
jgi:O-succinylbenzoic acid--CoA ligase